jgi:3-dehydroquinate dehydratase / shikimate dehydrogenase
VRCVFDLVYNPAETRLLQMARAQGIPTISGVEMFVYQGARQFEIWTGKPAPVEQMRGAVLRQLGVRAPNSSSAQPRLLVERVAAPAPAQPTAPPPPVPEKAKAGVKTRSDGTQQSAAKKSAPKPPVKASGSKGSKPKTSERRAVPAIAKKTARK